MRIGLGLEMDGTIDEVVARAAALRSTGVTSLWSSQIFGWDSLTVLAVVGREVPEVTLGTAVVPIHPRHPTMLAAQALTVQAACAGRFVLGVGLSHQVVVEGVWGYSYDHPARYMEEYLAILVPMLAGEQVSFQGEFLRANTIMPGQREGTTPPPVLVAALGTVMLGVAGREASGTITWMVGHQTLADHIVPTITAAATKAGRPPPEVVVNLPVSVTDDPDKARELAGRIFSIYGQLPSYRAMLDREGAAGPPDVAIVGDEDAVTTSIRRLEEAGATGFSAVPFGSAEEVRRTQAVLSALARS
jgi:5,10-methylenetetrahydromethanopterin reductase